jgi:hypothetical protein
MLRARQIAPAGEHLRQYLPNWACKHLDSEHLGVSYFRCDPAALGEKVGADHRSGDLPQDGSCSRVIWVIAAVSAPASESGRASYWDAQQPLVR